MPRPAKGARLYWRRGSSRKPAQWVILDTGGIERVTGTTDQRNAEKALSDYIRERDRGIRGAASAEELTVGQILHVYGEEHAPHVQDPARIAYAIDALLPFWETRRVAAVTAATCRRYAVERNAAQGTIRKELGTLRAAINYCHAEGVLLTAPKVTLPAKPPARDRVLTRDEVARLLRSARAKPELRHVARYILLALTGTRMTAVLSLRFERHPGGGWIDVERGVLYRRAADQIDTAKRRPPVKLPKRLLSHCRRWSREGGWVVNFRGARVASIKSSWRRVCQDANLPGVTRHTMKHTAITWAMMSGVPLADAAAYFGTTVRTLEDNYLHLHPEFQKATAEAMDRAGRA